MSDTTQYLDILIICKLFVLIFKTEPFLYRNNLSNKSIYLYKTVNFRCIQNSRITFYSEKKTNCLHGLVKL